LTPRHPRRHQLFVSDLEIALLERSLRCYAQVMQIQTSSTPQREAQDTAHLSVIVQQHTRQGGGCGCPSTIATPPERKDPADDAG
jgi:hypothetical protein